MIDPEADVKPSPRIVEDMRTLLEQGGMEEVDLKALGLRTISLEAVLDGLRKLYRIASGS